MSNGLFSCLECCSDSKTDPEEYKCLKEKEERKEERKEHKIRVVNVPVHYILCEDEIGNNLSN